MRRLLALCLLATSPAYAQNAGNDPVAMIRAEIERPVLFIIKSGSPVCFGRDGSAQATQANMTVTSNVDLSAPAQALGQYERMQFGFSPRGHLWFVGNVLQRFSGEGLSQVSQLCHTITEKLHTSALTADLGPMDGGGVLGTLFAGAPYRVYDFGGFKMERADLINEFNGVDQRTGAQTKFRSYNVRFVFAPIPIARTLAPQGFGHFDCVVAVKLDQLTLRWSYVPSTDCHWNNR